MTDSKTATERLRELLDERRVEWRETVNYIGCVFTHYKSAYFDEVSAMDNGDGYLYFEDLNCVSLTPEQAIAATLGDDGVERSNDGVATLGSDEYQRGYDDGLHANTKAAFAAAKQALGSGECENVAPRYLDFLCSKCGFVHYHSDENDTGDGNDWSYCPRCGKAVKR